MALQLAAQPRPRQDITAIQILRSMGESEFEAEFRLQIAMPQTQRSVMAFVRSQAIETPT